MWLNYVPVLLYESSMLTCTPLGVSLATHVACHDALRGVDLPAWYRTTHHRDITGKQTSSKALSSHQDDLSQLAHRVSEMPECSAAHQLGAQ